jgi:GNAT superfamily N-acetyltransferase
MSSTPSTNELITLGAPVVLRDGSHVRVRQGHRSDKQLLLRAFERLSPESRYRRFLVPMPELTEAMAQYLTEVDHHDHEAIIALDEETGEGIGVVRYVRITERRDAAEFAVTVIDDWQRRGVGTLLLGVLSARARAESITTFTALMLASNQEMMEVLHSLGPIRIVDGSLGTVEIEMAIPAVGLSPALSKLLRIAARSDVAVSLAGRLGARRHAHPDPEAAQPVHLERHGGQVGEQHGLGELEDQLSWLH